jgi:hypothetical protein
LFVFFRNKDRALSAASAPDDTQKEHGLTGVVMDADLLLIAIEAIEEAWGVLDHDLENP